MNAFDIPGYLQGHRFSDESSQFYDADSKEFKDLAGFSHLGNNLEMTVGTPTFEAHGAKGRKGILLDKTAQGRFIPAVPWQGTGLIVARMERLTTGTHSRYPYLFGNSQTETSNGFARLQAFGSEMRITLATAGGSLTIGVFRGSAGFLLICFCFDQQTRKSYKTEDGVTVSESPEVSDLGRGNEVAIGYGGTNGPASMYCRFGDLLGDGSTTPEADLKINVFEHHFWKGNVLTENIEKLQSFISNIKNYYGI